MRVGRAVSIATGVLLPALAACRTFGESPGTAADAGSDSAGEGGAVDAGGLPPAAACAPNPAAGLFCADFETAGSYGAFALECNAKAECSFVKEGGSGQLRLTTAGDGAGAKLVARPSIPAQRARCALDYRLEQGPSGAVSSLVAFVSTSNTEVANVEISGDGVISVRAGASSSSVGTGGAGPNHLVVDFGTGADMHATLNGGGTTNWAAQPTPIGKVEIGVIDGATSWKLVLDDVRCDLE